MVKISYSKWNGKMQFGGQSGFAVLGIAGAVVATAVLAGAGFTVYRQQTHEVSLSSSLVNGQDCGGAHCHNYKLNTSDNQSYDLKLSSKLPDHVKAKAANSHKSHPSGPANQKHQHESSTTTASWHVAVTGTVKNALPHSVSVKTIKPIAPSKLSRTASNDNSVLMTVVDSGSTNANGWELSVKHDGSGAYKPEASGNRVSPRHVRSFLHGTFDASDLSKDLASAHLKSSYHCFRSASFGSVKTLRYSHKKVTGIDCYISSHKTPLAKQLHRAIKTATKS